MKKNKKFPVDTLLFLVDTSEFDNFTIGVYTRLLFTQWENRDLPNDYKSLASISKCTEEEFKKVWPAIKHKFIQNDAGRFYNLRVEETRSQQSKTSFGKSLGGQASAESKKKNKDIKLIIYPWDTVLFKEKWEFWKKYKREIFKFKYKTIASEQIILNSLTKIADNENQAIELINHAIDVGWQGIYLPHNFNFKNGNTEKRSATDKGGYNPSAINNLNNAIKNMQGE